MKANSNRKYTFPIDRAPNGIPFGVMETEKCSYNPNLLSLTRSRNIFFGVNYYYYTAAVMKKKDLTVKNCNKKVSQLFGFIYRGLTMNTHLY